MNIEQAPSYSYVRSGRSLQRGDGAVMPCPRLARIGTELLGREVSGWATPSAALRFMCATVI